MFPKHANYLKAQLLRVYLFDLLILNIDRHIGNWGIVASEEGLNIYIFDNSLSFISGCPPKLVFNDESRHSKSSDLKGYHHYYPTLNELKYFIENAPLEYIDILKELYEELTPEIVEKVFALYTTGYEQSLQIYMENYEAIGLLLSLKR